MTDAERAFLQLLAELAGLDLFVGRPNVAERIIDAFEAAMQAQKRQIACPSPMEGPEQATEELGIGG